MKVRFWIDTIVLDSMPEWSIFLHILSQFNLILSLKQFIEGLCMYICTDFNIQNKVFYGIWRRIEMKYFKIQIGGRIQNKSSEFKSL